MGFYVTALVFEIPPFGLDWMGKYYCDYCDVYLTHDSPAVRKQHNDGNRHRMNFAEYYRQFIGESLQQQVDAVVYDFERRVALGLVVPTYGFATTVQSSSTLPMGFNPLLAQYETFAPSYYSGGPPSFLPPVGPTQSFVPQNTNQVSFPQTFGTDTK